MTIRTHTGGHIAIESALALSNYTADPEELATRFGVTVHRVYKVMDWIDFVHRQSEGSGKAAKALERELAEVTS